MAHGPSWSRGMWDLPRPGLEPVSPALAGRFSTTAPPGKPDIFLLRVFGFCVVTCVHLSLCVCNFIGVSALVPAEGDS